MTTVYLDTSLLVAALCNEPRGPSARKTIATDRGERPLVSDWTVTEFASALGLKVRRRDLPEHKALEAIGFLDAMVGNELELVPVDRLHYRTAAALCRAFNVALRAPDGLHLAVASQRRARVLTLDEGMWQAGRALGIKVDLVA